MNWTFKARPCLGKLTSFPAAEASVQDINPIVNQINDLKGRIRSLRGYL